MSRIVLFMVLVGIGAGPVWASSMVAIPAGTFFMGEHAVSGQQVMLGAFFIDRFEATNEEYSASVPGHSYPEGAELHPVSGIDWAEAQAYCAKQGKSLPTEAEWEKSARGDDGRMYPWGNAVPREKPHPYFSGLIKRRVGMQKQDVSPYGVYGMAGSVWEWTLGESAGKKVVRGGLWNLHLDYEYSKTYDQNFAVAGQKLPFIGVRCARSK